MALKFLNTESKRKAFSIATNLLCGAVLVRAVCFESYKEVEGHGHCFSSIQKTASEVTDRLFGVDEKVVSSPDSSS